jgi:putative flippase GtrA
VRLDSELEGLQRRSISAIRNLARPIVAATGHPRGGAAEERIKKIFQRPVSTPRSHHPVPEGAALRPEPQGAGLRHFVRFNLVGVMGVVVQLAALYLFNRILRFGELFSTAAAVEAAVLHNFVWHERFTWVDRVGAAAQSFASQKVCASSVFSRSPFGRLLLFNFTNGAVSLAGNIIFMALLIGQAHLPLLASNLVAIACCALLNFVLSDRLVFRRMRSQA